MNDYNNKLGKMLLELRTEKGMSLRDFSEYLSISHAYLSKLEKGVDPRTGRPIMPTIDTLKKISDGLKIPMESFLSDCGYMEDSSVDENTALELNVLADEFIAAITEATSITLDGREISGDTKYFVNLAVDLIKRNINY